MIDKKTSYTAADSIPIKVLMDDDLITSIKQDGIIKPIHIQIIPTNRCNLNCSFCSCSVRTKDQELDFELMKKIIDKCKNLGTKAVTITGGGEPILYRHFNEMIDYFDNKGIKIGLVTNGIGLHKVDIEKLNKVTWCRISNGDERTFDDKYSDMLSSVVTNASKVDWAFSHVLSDNPNLELIGKMVNFSNLHNFTHVRLVSDLFRPEDISMKGIKDYLAENNISDKLVVYQNRKNYTRGGDCYIGYLKPLIGADAKVYLCCGVQYALDPPTYDLPQELCLGDAINIDKIIKDSSSPANGHICVKCYYMNYNIILKSMMSKIDHKEFL